MTKITNEIEIEIRSLYTRLLEKEHIIYRKALREYANSDNPQAARLALDAVQVERRKYKRTTPILLKRKLKILGMKITNKKFRPHATIARVKSKRNTRELARSIQELSEIEIGTMKVTSFKLKKSELRPRGPIYTDLKIRQLEPLQ